MVDWPETRSGSGPVVIACPESEGRTVTRECNDGTWTEADYSVCLSFADIEAMVSFHKNLVHRSHAPHHIFHVHIYIVADEHHRRKCCHEPWNTEFCGGWNSRRRTEYY